MDSDDDTNVSGLLRSALDAFKTPAFRNVMSHTSQTHGPSASSPSAIGESTLSSYTHHSETPSVPSARSSSTDSVIDPSLRPVEHGLALFTNLDSTDHLSDVQTAVTQTSVQVRHSFAGKQPKTAYKRRAYGQISSDSSDDENDHSESDSTRRTYIELAEEQVMKYGLPEDLATDVRKFAGVRTFPCLTSIQFH